MSKLFLPNTRHKLLDENGNITHMWMAFFSDLFTRVGGFNSYTVTEAEASEFDDAGIEEIKADLYRFKQDQDSAPLVQAMSEQMFAMESAMIAMRDELAQVSAELDSLKASTTTDELAQLRADIENALTLRDELAQLIADVDGIKAGTTL